MNIVDENTSKEQVGVSPLASISQLPCPLAPSWFLPTALPTALTAAFPWPTLSSVLPLNAAVPQLWIVILTSLLALYERLQFLGLSGAQDPVA